MLVGVVVRGVVKAALYLRVLVHEKKVDSHFENFFLDTITNPYSPSVNAINKRSAKTLKIKSVRLRPKCFLAALFTIS